MQQQRYRVRILNLDWFSITYRALIFWGIIFFAAGSIGGYIIYKRYFHKFTPERQAANAIMEAANLIARIELSSTEVESYLIKPKGLLSQARDLYRKADYVTAYDYGIEAKEKALEILQGIERGRVGVQKATITSTEGDVKIRKSNSFKWTRAEVRERVYPGDMIRTASNSSIRIMFFEGTGYTIGSDSLVVIDESFENPISKAKKIGVKLNSGELDMETPKSFTSGTTSTVKSPTVQASLQERSEAAMSFNPTDRETVFSLYRGKAEVSTDKAQYEIAPREQVVVDGEKNLVSHTGIPDRVTLIFPPNKKLFLFDDVAAGTVDFQWSRPNNAEYFQFQLSLNALFSKPLRDKRNIEDNFMMLKTLDKGTYFWRVRGFFSNGKPGSYCNPFSFRIITPEERISMADTTPPMLEVEKPLPFANIILLSGKTEPGVLLTANNHPIDVDEDGNFKDFLTLEEEGLNTITIIAQDPSGNETMVQKKVYVEMF